MTKANASLGRFPTQKLRRALWLYKALWIILFPAILGYLWLRGRKDPIYFGHLRERFGSHGKPQPGAVWVHAVSLGELRSAVPLIRALLDRGETIVTTHFTPTGRAEAERVFGTDIAAGRMQAVWVPFEYRWCYARFLRAFAPKYGLVMEIEIWPEMILSARRHGVPLFMCNAQYPSKSFAKDHGRARADLMRGFAGALVKSDLQRDRFASVGVAPIVMTGELRFDQPLLAGQVAAGVAARAQLAPAREVVTLTSVVDGEDATYIAAILALPAATRPLFVYVPRKPERFDTVANLLASAGLRVARRSTVFDAALTAQGTLTDIDVLLGDSMGEMYFYLSLSDRAVVGGGFTPHGAHNVIEPLALRKPVIVGPEIWTIEYPATEAIAAGVCTRVQTKAELVQALSVPAQTTGINDFFAAHSGAVARTLAAIDQLTRR